MFFKAIVESPGSAIFPKEIAAAVAILGSLLRFKSWISSGIADFSLFFPRATADSYFSESEPEESDLICSSVDFSASSAPDVKKRRTQE